MCYNKLSNPKNVGQDANLASFFYGMKWIQTAPGSYKLVEDSDERPEVKFPSRAFGKSNIHTKYSPDWKKFEEGMHKGTPQQQAEAADKFIEAREHILKVDKQAKRWEESRKESWAKDKPQWREEMMKGGTW